MLTKKYRTPKIGVSILTLLFIVPPFCPQYGKRLNLFCQKTGFGLQLVPLWMMSCSDIATIKDEYVISYEGAWNENETIGKLFKRVFCFWKKPWDPTALLGPALFGFSSQQEKRMMCIRNRFRHAFAIDTEAAKNAKSYELTETSPSNWDAIENKFQIKNNICVDLWHLRENSVLPNDCKNGLAKINRLINYWGGRKIKLIHFQTRNKRELDEFVQSNEECFLRTALLKLAHNEYGEASCIPIIIELKPCSLQMLFLVRERILSAMKT